MPLEPKQALRLRAHPLTLHGHRGVLAIALLRSVPVAPFGIVNLAAGSIGVPPREYVLGTALGLAPGIVLMTAFGNRPRSMWDTPKPGNVAMLARIAAAWLATVVKRVASRVRTKAPRATSRS